MRPSSKLQSPWIPSRPCPAKGEGLAGNLRLRFGILWPLPTGVCPRSVVAHSPAGYTPDNSTTEYNTLPKKKSTASLRKGDRAYYDSLTEEQLDEHWARRAELDLNDAEERFLRAVVRDRKGFKPVEVHVSICQRCNLPAENCACLNP